MGDHKKTKFPSRRFVCNTRRLALGLALLGAGCGFSSTMLPSVPPSTAAPSVTSSTQTSKSPDAVTEDGYDHWLRYRVLPDATLLKEAKGALRYLAGREASPILNAAHKELRGG